MTFDGYSRSLIIILLYVHHITMHDLKDVFVAGADTSLAALEWVMTELVRHPCILTKAQDEVRRALAGHGNKVTEDKLANLHYLPLVIKETLRLHPPAPLLLPRRCGSPCQVLGFDVPEGAMVIVNAWAIGRDGESWGGGRGRIPDGEVARARHRRRRCRLRRPGHPVHSVRSGEERVPQRRLRDAPRGARADQHALPFRLGAAGRPGRRLVRVRRVEWDNRGSQVPPDACRGTLPCMNYETMVCVCAKSGKVWKITI